MRALALLALAAGASVASAVAFSMDHAVSTIYDRSPKLRLRGDWGAVDEHTIHLKFFPNLIEDKNYLLTKQDDNVLVLKLLLGHRWAELANSPPPVSLMLTSVKMDGVNDGDELLQAPMQVASIIPTPDIKSSTNIIYMTATSILTINGTGFDATTKNVKLLFDPPRIKELDYDVARVKSGQIALALRPGQVWRDEPGPLYVRGIDTGGGVIKVGGDDGVLVAEVQADLDAHGVSVDDNPTNLIYQDMPDLVINGEGFNPDASKNKLRFANGLLGAGVNFTVTAASSNMLRLKLSAGSVWRKKNKNLPGNLVLLAVDSGAGYVAVGPTNAKKGRTVARVYARPTVSSSTENLYRTHSHKLHIFGRGFPTDHAIDIEFDPPLVRGVDYDLTVVSDSELEVELRDGRAWRPDSGPLRVMAVTTIGALGRIPLGTGVHVADIVDDVESDETGGISVTPTQQKVYQSALHETITIQGRGFKTGMKLTLDPPITAGTDYDMEVMGDAIKLTLRAGRSWRSEPGALYVKSVAVGGQTHSFANGGGIRVATVLQDPVVTPGDSTLHESQSKALVIRGQGFTDGMSTTLKLTPTPGTSYKISLVLEDTIRVLLQEAETWLPSYMTVEEGDRVPVRVTGVDTGAGLVQLAGEGVVVGYVVPDREGVVCDDSCEFAFDSVCDDQTSVMDENWGWGFDDDYGGYYDDYYYQKGYYDDYYLDDKYAVSACLPGTDCTDCGGVDAIDAEPEETCANSCAYARDGICDDPRGGNYCSLGTDCQDCGPVGESNFTYFEDDGWWDDDDQEWDMTDDDLFKTQADGYEAHRHRRDTPPPPPPGAGVVFLTVLQGMVYTVGAVIAVVGAWFGYRWYKGYSIPFLAVFSPDNQLEMESGALPTRHAITPDVVRT
eukprot:CAMPEP_0198428070 /NCGR_PEP_ID=MMETSP1452-20131203/6326_1 /TAXON_ID=1181717 /ORGANISM="Synchroma pusillum, Strain CCMP3072" /LENGTH=894 /DNA_ID=CAMNT_0044148453 /DNA_START=16 /DNA_END=2700 /DNA_ORIENTATION=+